ncbi:trans-acting enoyl reductase family protein [Mycobacterium sp. 852002-51057_SCH5723018]|uniref:saccharopine dehydrogenase family protein n=1 Tax=Mycobacterium sp. 852002-51057_SCH5723018 TaxID=1834094 RepID=UPI0007FD0B1B|nr:saccharopine dehydrogenase NADP-binding domain-containing protein [Mycobacterium sp. 852002-51057_SCH5723018]OBG18653.1 hypothetical protein A5764_17755 [Mycobacterium sp. 852002-51057_SCH5723018]
MTGRAAPAPIGVYGATGYTGKFVARQLADRGHRPVLCGRDAGRLAEVAADLPTACETYQAGIDDLDALQCFAQRCAVVINCAGPFSRYGQPVAEAAVRAGAHYLDHTSEPDYLYGLIRELDGPARAAGSVVVPGMSFFTALADLIAHRLAAPMGPLHRVTVAYAIDGWKLTPGSLATKAARTSSAHVVYRDGRLQLLPSPSEPRFDTYRFPPTLTTRPVIADYSGTCEAVTVPRHVQTGAVDVYMTQATFFPTDDAPHNGSGPGEPRDSTQFSIVVDAYGPTDPRRSWISGVGDIYEIGALVSVEAAERLTAGKAINAGVVSPAEAFPDPELLDALVAMPFIDGGLRTEPMIAEPAALPTNT